jgi:hypothetical protein
LQIHPKTVIIRRITVQFHSSLPVQGAALGLAGKLLAASSGRVITTFLDISIKAVLRGRDVPFKVTGTYVGEIVWRAHANPIPWVEI